VDDEQDYYEYSSFNEELITNNVKNLPQYQNPSETQTYRHTLSHSPSFTEDKSVIKTINKKMYYNFLNDFNSFFKSQ